MVGYCLSVTQLPMPSFISTLLIYQTLTMSLAYTNYSSESLWRNIYPYRGGNRRMVSFIDIIRPIYLAHAVFPPWVAAVFGSCASGRWNGDDPFRKADFRRMIGYLLGVRGPKAAGCRQSEEDQRAERQDSTHPFRCRANTQGRLPGTSAPAGRTAGKSEARSKSPTTRSACVR